MDTVQIQHALKEVNSFLGVYASDPLPLSIVQTGTIIVNTDPTRSLSYTGRLFILKTPTAPLAVTFSIPTAAILSFPPS